LQRLQSCPLVAKFDCNIRIEADHLSVYFAKLRPARFFPHEQAVRKGDSMHWLIAVVLNVIFVTPPAAAQNKVPQAWDAKTIQWQQVDSDGTKWAILEGRSELPGEAFTYAAFVPAGFCNHHRHTTDARVAVVQGTLKVSFGDALDVQSLKPYPAGSFLFVPANVKHTMATDEDTILIGTAFGPWDTHHHERDSHHAHN